MKLSAFTLLACNESSYNNYREIAHSLLEPYKNPVRNSKTFPMRLRGTSVEQASNSIDKVPRRISNHIVSVRQHR